jgi:hypothetical protein
VTTQSRSAVIGCVVSIAAFAVLGIAGTRAWRSLCAVALVGAFGWLVVPLIASNAEDGTFDRYATITPAKAVDTAYDYRVDDNAALSHYITQFPFGAGIGMTGPATSFGAGPRPFETRRESFNAETQFNYLTIELGVPGLVLFTAFQVLLLGLVATRLRSVKDPDSRTYLAGAFAPCFVILAGGLGGATTAAPPSAPWFWLTAGMAAYWLVHLRSTVSGARRREPEPHHVPAW